MCGGAGAVLQTPAGQEIKVKKIFKILALLLNVNAR